MPIGNVVVGAFTDGSGILRLQRPNPVPTVKGSVDVCVNLSTDTPNTCTTATSANMAWLHGNWRGTAYDDNPAVRATFGVYRGGPVIYLREIH
jgi:MSHA biogenesis protein MshQ